MVSNQYIVKTEGNKPLNLRALQEIIKKEIPKWGKKINVELFEPPIKIQTRIPRLKPLNIARIYGENGFDSVLVTKANKTNIKYSTDPALYLMTPFYLIEIGIPYFPSPSLPETESIKRILGQYKELAKKIEQEVPGIESLVFV